MSEIGHYMETVSRLKAERDALAAEVERFLNETLPRLESEQQTAHERLERLEKWLMGLEAARATMTRRWHELLDNADQDDDDGAHVGLARHSRAVARGIGEAIEILNAELPVKERTDD